MPARKPKIRKILKVGKKPAKFRREKKAKPSFSELDINHGLMRNRAVLIWLKDALKVAEKNPREMIRRLVEAAKINQISVLEHKIEHEGKVDDVISLPLKRILGGNIADRKTALEKLILSVEKNTEKNNSVLRNMVRKAA